MHATLHFQCFNLHRLVILITITVIVVTITIIFLVMIINTSTRNNIVIIVIINMAIIFLPSILFFLATGISDNFTTI